MKNKKYSRYAILSVVALMATVFIYNDFLCSGVSCYELEISLFEPLFFGALGLSASLLLLLFFSEQVFISWLKHVAWWFVLGTIAIVLSINPYAGGILTIDRGDTTIYSMTVLFVLTLIYALIMQWRHKKTP